MTRGVTFHFKLCMCFCEHGSRRGRKINYHMRQIMVIHRVQWHASCANHGGSSRWRRVVCCKLYVLFSDPNNFSAAPPRTESCALQHSCTVSIAFAGRCLGSVPVLVKHGYLSLQGKENIFLLLLWEYWYLTLPFQWLAILSRYVFFLYFLDNFSELT